MSAKTAKKSLQKKPRKKDPTCVLRRRVSLRDRDIYEAVYGQMGTQAEVGEKYGLSQARVSVIVKRVEKWLGMRVPPGLNELPREDRLRAASRTHLMELRCLQREAMAAWHESKKPKLTRKSKGSATESVPEASVVTQHGDRRHWQDAMLATQRIREFEGFDQFGHVDISCTGRVPEAPEQTNTELFRDIKRRVMTGFFDTEEDEGIPGAWEKEMKRRNAAVAAKSPGVGAVVGQPSAVTANSGRPENRPEPIGVAGPHSVASAKGPGEFSGQPVVAKPVQLPEKTPDRVEPPVVLWDNFQLPIWLFILLLLNPANLSGGVGTIFGQQEATNTSSRRPENRPDPFMVAKPIEGVQPKGSGDFSGRPVIAEGVALPEKAEGPARPATEKDYGDRLAATTCYSLFGANPPNSIGGNKLAAIQRARKLLYSATGSG